MSDTPEERALQFANKACVCTHAGVYGLALDAFRELTAALAAKEALVKERDEARAMANLSSLAVDATFECFEDEGKKCDQLRSQLEASRAECERLRKD